ncbi:MAG: SRPBCC domain-containing protein [Anaerolineales bacterium]|nr:SRPBCC domain-containing protein [Anaerolineales bacterium]
MQKQLNSSVQISWFYTQSPSKLWQAWTDPSAVKLWFGSDPNGKVLDANLDVSVDGFFRVTFANSDGAEFTCKGKYKEIELNKMLVFTWGWEDRPAIMELVSVNFEIEKDGTLMLFEHQNIDQNSAHNYEEGWRSTFTKLEKALDQLS